jgi:3-hydroxyacyl-[acyl-carrier-protein] dehydratase
MTEITTQQNSENKVIDIKEIMRMIPHRYPFLLVDKVTDIVSGESVTGIKNVTMNEPHFTGHFPNHPVMPGVLIIEAMAQTAAVLVIENLGAEAEGKIVYFTSIDGAKFRKPVVPGDVLNIKVKKLQNKRTLWKFEGVAEVDGKVVAEATISAMLMM